MRRIVLIVVLACSMSGLVGCFTMDAEHNKRHWEVIRKDIREWHSDLDFILGLDQPTMLESHVR